MSSSFCSHSYAYVLFLKLSNNVGCVHRKLCFQKQSKAIATFSHQLKVFLNIQSCMSQSQPKSYTLPTKAPSWAKLTIALGSIITIYSFYEYFSSGGGVSGSALGFVYGLPILLLGFALQYAELAPATLETSDEARKKREYLATDVQKKLISDVTRYRYGNQAHLEQVWKSLGLVSRGKARPILKQVLERIDETSYRYELCLLLYSADSQVSLWEQKLERMNRFFGPNIVCRIQPIEEDQFWLVLESLQDSLNK
ncbi:hypothetical protein GpartN1_g2291.t1 [Galdieria partita]|uniref:Thylakoid membrane protein n=1 Tax=Galdieria partita TaxID=83374 RepID=A0A9C7PU79_9RHOD|nr:hypothetical protein GpartN1_g2291.t1 [Galdieria partita]